MMVDYPLTRGEGNFDERQDDDQGPSHVWA